MSKRGIIAILIGIFSMGIIATPFILRAIPPRYVAAYFPEPLQDIVSPKTESPILPTIVQAADISVLLAQSTPENDVDLLAAPPATFTPVSVQGAEVAVADTAVPATSTPIPYPTNTPIPIPASARLEGFNHHFQEWNNCGPATMAMTLSYFGLGLTQTDTAADLKPNPEDRNVSPSEMADYVNTQTTFQAIYRVNGHADTIKRLVAAGIPVIIEIGIEPPGEFQWMGWYGHYLLVVAYDDAAQQFWVYDSWFGTSLVPGENADTNGRSLTYSDLAINWPHFNRNYIVVYPPEQETAVANIIGTETDDATMWQKSLTVAQRDAAADPENAFFWFNLGTTYNALGDYESAATAYDQARSIGLPWRMLWYQFGPYEAYYEAGRYDDVILLADVTLKDRPYFEESFYYKGLAQTALGDAVAGQSNIEKAANFNPNFTPAVIALNQLEDGG